MLLSTYKYPKRLPTYSKLHVRPTSMEKSSSSSLSLLNDCQVRNSRLLINRLHFLIHGIALLFLFYYRLTTLAQIAKSGDRSSTSLLLFLLLPHILTLIAEAVLAFLWLLNLPSKWRPLVRKAYPERLPADDGLLPGVDVFVCTADPNKEPSVGVMNTVISALALDYPPDKLHVYVSDDGGSHVTLEAARQAWEFARVWLPFCRKYGVKTRCPEAYFREGNEVGGGEFLREEKEIEGKYQEFKSRVSQIVGVKGAVPVSRNHSPIIEVISEGDEQMPFFAYVAREKRPSNPHHFKAGALNVLLRVSALITNSPYILALDCDMYCNDPSSARQAMCFHLDPKLSPNLAFVQFPQKFHNINSANDIYDGQWRYLWEKWEGLDGLQGPILSGTGFYAKRQALCGAKKFQEDRVDLEELKKCYGLSNEFIKTIFRNDKPNNPNGGNILDESLHEELRFLASCSYDKGTKWGDEVGFRYFSLVEDYFTSFNLHCEGWKSVYVNPVRACFLGSTPISLGDHMVQNMRWYFGLAQIALSRFSPLVHGPLRMSISQSMCYAEFAYAWLNFVPLYVLATVPQICLLRGIPLYPQVSSPFFVVFLFVFFSSQLKHAHEVLATGESMRAWLAEKRTRTMYSLTSFLFASMDVVLEKSGLRAANFLLTNKAVDDELEKRYRLGLYDFQAPTVFMVPLCSLYMLNVVSFVFGFGRLMLKGNEMVIQGLIPLFIVVLHCHLFGGMVLRKDKGRVPLFVVLTSAAAVCALVLSVGIACYSPY